jgi:hypothetical protein
MDEMMKEKIEDHENRIRNLETNTLEMKFELLNIGKSQADLKSLFLEQGKEYKKILDNYFAQMSEIFNTNDKIRLIDRKEVWGIVALIIGITLPILLK